MTDVLPCRLAISIINYRTGDLTWGCVQSVLADLGGRTDATIVVVDNASGDGSAEMLAQRIAALPPGGTPVRLIASPVNGGFSAGHNLGMGAVAADWYLVLNSDAILRPGFVDIALQAGDGAPADIGILAPRLEDEDGTPQVSLFRFPTPVSEIIRGANTGPITKVLSRWDVPIHGEAAPGQIGWASFACILLRGAMVRAIGPMDQGYFLYFEDAEYCLRARRAGSRLAPLPQARAVHFRGGSGPVKSLATARKRLPAYYYASRSRFMRQIAGPVGPLLANLGWIGGRGVAHLRRLTGRDVPGRTQGEAGDIWINSLRPLTGSDRRKG